MSIIKNALLLGAGYVIGTAAGRERYEKIKLQATKLVQRPEVKQAGRKAQDAVVQKLPGGGGQGGDASSSSTSGATDGRASGTSTTPPR